MTVLGEIWSNVQCENVLVLFVVAEAQKTHLTHTFSLCQHTPLNAPGIYIRTLIPDGPAASDGRLRIGDRILAVNGTSLIGADYQRYVSTVRSLASLLLKLMNWFTFCLPSFVSCPILLYGSTSAVDLIRMGGGRLRFLVAKSDPEVSEKISASSCWCPPLPSWHAQTLGGMPKISSKPTVTWMWSTAQRKAKHASRRRHVMVPLHTLPLSSVWFNAGFGTNIKSLWGEFSVCGLTSSHMQSEAQ